jgi:hypothetical protein
MEQAPDPYQVQVFPGQQQGPAKGHREDADIHGMEGGVFVPIF